MAYKKFTQSAAQLTPDTRYSSRTISKFINFMMLDGKKSVATRLMYDALDIVQKRVPDTAPDEVFEQAVEGLIAEGSGQPASN